MEDVTRMSASSTRRRTDWDAVERDYRTGRFTLRELGAKHGVSHQSINDRAKRHGWTRDLAEQIRIATHARLAAQLVQQESDRAGRDLATTVLAAAEVNARVIQRHRQRLEALARDAELARKKLMDLTETVSDAKEATTLVSAVEAAVRTEKILIEQERKSYRLDDEDNSRATVKPKRVVIDFEDIEVKE